MALSRSQWARYLNVASLVVALLGIALSLMIFLTADDAPSDVLGYEIVNGISYPIKAEEDRKTQYEVERMGGKMGLLIMQFNDWFSGLWHGRALAYTLGVLTLAGVALLRFIAREMSL